MAASSGTAVVTLPTDTTILITREFNAPRRLLYRAWTTPELITRWWGGERGEVTSAEVDLRVKGRWRYVMVATGGFEGAFHGEYQEIVPDQLLVATQVYEAYPEVEAVATHTFTKRQGRTTLSIFVQHPTQQTRDAHIQSGMEAGMNEAMDRLEQVAASLG